MKKRGSPRFRSLPTTDEIRSGKRCPHCTGSDTYATAVGGFACNACERPWSKSYGDDGAMKTEKIVTMTPMGTVVEQDLMSVGELVDTMLASDDQLMLHCAVEEVLTAIVGPSEDFDDVHKKKVDLFKKPGSITKHKLLALKNQATLARHAKIKANLTASANNSLHRAFGITPPTKRSESIADVVDDMVEGDVIDWHKLGRHHLETGHGHLTARTTRQTTRADRANYQSGKRAQQSANMMAVGVGTNLDLKKPYTAKVPAYRPFRGNTSRNEAEEPGARMMRQRLRVATFLAGRKASLLKAKPSDTANPDAGGTKSRGQAHAANIGKRSSSR